MGHRADRSGPYIPIHTEARDWFANSFENVVLVAEGQTYKF